MSVACGCRGAYRAVHVDGCVGPEKAREILILASLLPVRSERVDHGRLRADMAERWRDCGGK